MIRGTTPTLTFNLPFAVSELQSAYITIESKDEEVTLEKALADCTKADKSLAIKLTQEETLAFESRKQVRIQLRVLTKSGEALASPIYTAPMHEILKDGVIV